LTLLGRIAIPSTKSSSPWSSILSSHAKPVIDGGVSNEATAVSLLCIVSWAQEFGRWEADDGLPSWEGKDCPLVEGDPVEASNKVWLLMVEGGPFVVPKLSCAV
jgi:hypothetical protein